jgi:hypothetical protein
MKTKGVRDAKHGGAPTNARRPRRPVVLCAGIAVVDFIFRVEREALRNGSIAGAALDVTVDEPLPPASPLWDLPNIFITPHTAGETRRYEDNVLDILLENLHRLWRGEAILRNQIV